ncbi:MAG: NADH-quinone oxidoreductase subunit NuoH [Armatimonadetes bacterium]|nr:NADH-quinone oxidoreductase subunit NuoH [Armatimonadota bacterium]NIO75064.1 NADH-quinone oxidoreductase subunit NuoH [Armatimonadota bacterium]NIO95714.1 NADH-quinone oxidoreductase subunit NuoH [Armatimonadota bacterium]
MPWAYLVEVFIICVFVLIFILINLLMLIWLERKVSGDIQARIGPIRVGPLGLFQTAADALKLMLKEDVIPAAADKWTFIISPFMVFLPAMLVYIVLPFDHNLVPQDLSLGVLFIVAVGTLPTIGIIMAGWGSNNKYSMLGAMRGAAQAISYEVPLVLVLATVVMWTGTLSTKEIVEAQQGMWLIGPLFIGFLLFLTCGIAEVNRTPFDIPEAESELVAGFHVEYSGMRFAFFFMGEYAHMLFVSGLISALFLGGWHFLPYKPNLWLIPGWVWFLAKTYALVLVIMWIRWTYPRLRVDQLMKFSWKGLVPVSLAYLLIMGFVKVWWTG